MGIVCIFLELPYSFKIYLPFVLHLDVRTDSLFYQIFHTSPGIFFELIGRSATEANGYEFRSVEIKQPDFRIDGVFVPSSKSSSQTVYFVEVQFQKDQLEQQESRSVNKRSDVSESGR